MEYSITKNLVCLLREGIGAYDTGGESVFNISGIRMYSLIETAKLNMHEPYNYLRWLFTELPKLNGGDVDGLMP